VLENKHWQVQYSFTLGSHWISNQWIHEEGAFKFQLEDTTLYKILVFLYIIRCTYIAQRKLACSGWHVDAVT